MNDNDYRVIFSGKISEGKKVEEVAVELAALFMLDLNDHEHAAKLAKLLSPRPVVIKQGLSRSAALKYQNALAAAGAICTIQNMKEVQAKTRPQQERRKQQRRKYRDRRATRRTSAIMPDRRKTPGHRKTDLPFEG